MNIVTKATHGQLTQETRNIVEEKLSPVARLLGDSEGTALLEVEIEAAPAEGRSSAPTRLVANLTTDGQVFHAEAVKPSPASAADRVRSELESEIKKTRGRAHRLWKRGRAAVKDALRGWRS